MDPCGRIYGIRNEGNVRSFQVETRNCQVAFSHKKVTEDEFELQLISDQINSDEYIAVGLSQDQFMRNDAVIACTTAYR